MILLSDVISFLRPGAEWTLSGDSYEGLTWLDTIQAQPTEDEVANGYIALAAKNRLNQLINDKTLELSAAYTAAQQISVTYGNTFLIPLIGNFFDIVAANQVLEAQISGSASLLATDVNGVQQLISEVPFADWLAFYKTAKKTAFGNIVINNQLLSQIASAKTVDDVSAIDVNVFPPMVSITIPLSSPS